jgi:hypothetical protein
MFSPEPGATAGVNGVRTSVTILNAVPGLGAWGTAECDGRMAFFGRGTVATHGLADGDRIEALLIPNLVKPDHTPWFGKRVFGPAGADDLAPALRDVLSRGGVWTLADLAEQISAPVSHADAALEHLYDAGEVSKFVLFRKSGMKADKVWYTAFPDRADVDEWEEEDE